MNIFVCLKQTPDTEATIKVSDGKVQEDAVNKWIISPYDEYAIEEALQFKKQHGGSVTVFSLGPDRVVEALRQAYALGVDKTIHLKDEAFEGNDSFATAKALAEAIKQEGEFDLLLAGIIGQDQDNGQTAIMLSELLDVPHIGIVTKLDIEDGKAKAEGEVEGGKGIFEASLPVMITTQQGLNEPRYPSLKGIMAAKKKKIETKGTSDLGLDAGKMGATGSSLEILSQEYPPERPEGRIIEGEEAADKAKNLVEALKEVKVI